MSYYVYMLITSDKNKKVSYVGYTKDLKKESNCIIQEKGKIYTWKKVEACI